MLAHAGVRDVGRLHDFHEIQNLTAGVFYRAGFDVDVLLSARRVMNVQHTAHLPGFQALLQRALFAGEIARHGVAVAHLVTVPAAQRRAVAVVVTVSLVGHQNAVVPTQTESRDLRGNRGWPVRPSRSP